MIRDIDNTKQPLLEHLVELRQRLVRSAIVIVIAFLPCFYFAQDIYNFLAMPLYDVVVKSSCQEPGVVEWVDSLLVEHFNFGILDEAERNATPQDLANCEEIQEQSFRIIFTGPAEAFLTLVKVGFFASLCISLPMIVLQLWGFVAPGLYLKEKKVVLPFMFFFPLLFLMGAAMVYYAFFPVALEFLLSFQQDAGPDQLQIDAEFRISEYFNLLLKLIFAFGVSFQLPLIIYFLARVGATSSKGLREKRKYAIVGVFVLAAVITPPDPFSQLGLALPLILLYEISIWVAGIVERRRGEAMGEGDDPDGGDDDAADVDDDFIEETDFNPTR
ncbi:MAG: twin-arginine translocase subunit TatC [Pseudomonadota bacterium]